MGSLRFDGVLFLFYSNDHHPPHLHARYAGCEVVIDLLLDGTFDVSDRTDALRPRNTPRSVVRRILRLANRHAHELTSSLETSHE